MAKYFQSYADTGELKIQIDDEFLNLEFKSKTSYNIAANNSVFISYTGTTACLAVQSSYYVAVQLESLSGNTWTWRITNLAGRESGVSDQTISVVAFIFAATTNAFAAPSAGLQIFNESSQLVYDSAKRYMRVVGYGTTMNASSTYTQILEAGKTYASCSLSSNFGFQRLGFPPGPGPFYQSIETTSNSVFRVRNSTFLASTQAVNSQITPPRTTPWSSDELYSKDSNYGQFLILDVTGY